MANGEGPVSRGGDDGRIIDADSFEVTGMLDDGLRRTIAWYLGRA